jgi:hypothetical protein
MVLPHPAGDVRSAIPVSLFSTKCYDIGMISSALLHIFTTTSHNPPYSAGLIGYITNVLALEMTFKPIEYVGLNIFRIKNQPWGLFGWQGIIPTKVCLSLSTQHV